MFEYCIVENVINIDVLLAIIKIYSNKRYHHGIDTHINKLAIYQKRIVWFLDTINHLPRGNFSCLEFSILVLHDFIWPWKISENLHTTIKTFVVLFGSRTNVYSLDVLDTCCKTSNWQKETIIHSKMTVEEAKTSMMIFFFNWMYIKVEKYCNEIESIINFDSMIYIKSLCHLECSWCYLYIPRHEYYSRHERNKLHVTGNAPNT